MTSKGREVSEAERTYRVVQAEGVALDVGEYLQFIAITRSEPENAMRWAQGLDRVLEGLDRFPTRYAVIAGTEHFERPLRQLMYHSHRVIYEVFLAERVVRVLYVWHGARGTDPDYTRRIGPLGDARST